MAHVSQLKMATGFKGVAVPSLPSDQVALEVPLQMLRARLIARRGHQATQALIRWSELPFELATWEDLDALRQQFPAAPAWVQAGFQERGNVSMSTVLGADQAPSVQHRSSGPRRGMRARRPTVCLCGPEWV